MSSRGLWRRLLVAAVVTLPVVTACGTTSPTSQASPSSVVSPAPAASPLTCSSGGPASASWVTPDKAGTTPPITSAVASGDTLTLTFTQETPTFEVTTQPTAKFTANTGRGETVVLSGSAGVRISLRGFRGDMQNYTGPKDFMAGGNTQAELREMGDFEGVVGWAAGLSKAGCANVAVGPSRLTFTFFAK